MSGCHSTMERPERVRRVIPDQHDGEGERGADESQAATMYRSRSVMRT